MVLVVFSVLPPTLTPTLFPYTTLFRSDEASVKDIPGIQIVHQNGFLGVVAPKEWDAIKAMQQLKVEWRSEEHTSELQSHSDLVCRLLLEKKNRGDVRHDDSIHVVEGRA